MKDAVLAVSFICVMLGVLLWMKRLERRMTINQAVQKDWDYACKQRLRIAFSNPLVAGGVSDALMALGKRFPDEQVSLYCGDADVVARLFEEGKVEIAFLPFSYHTHIAVDCDTMEVKLSQEKLTDNIAGLQILSIDDEPVMQCMAWQEKECDEAAHQLVELMTSEVQAQEKLTF
ncbi:MAG: hypothetical protein PHI98_14335 [Eubacteriales bacterium]|nr:hypothetical protein [Eubacteriales bacterium]